MPIIVTGGAGFIGSHFLHFIKDKTDQKIIVLDNLTYASNLNNIPKDDQFEFIWCDIANEKHVNYLFDRYHPIKVFHFAAESHVDNSIKNYRPFLEANLIGTINLLNASLNCNVEKFHHISTDEVYGSLDYEDIDLFKESSQIDPRNPYSASKAAAEHYVKSWHNTYDLPYLITSCSNNYGPYQHIEKLIPRVITNALKGEKTYMFGGGMQIRDWINVIDHCEAIWQLDEHKVINDKFNIGANCEKRNIDVTKKILDIMNKSHDLIGISLNKNELHPAPYFRPGQDSRYGTDSSKLKNKIGWRPKVDFDEGLKNTVNWYLQRYQHK